MRWTDPLLAGVFVALSCGLPAPLGEPECVPLAHVAPVLRYPFHGALRTPLGLLVDPSGQEVDLARLDAYTAHVGACLAGMVPRVVPYRCLSVKVAPDWYLSPCSGLQVLPHSPGVGCGDKPEVPGGCPCRYRATLDGSLTIVTAPDLAAYGGPLAMALAGISEPWAEPWASCLRP